MDELTFTLEDFEGPLDLLLALIAKNKMDLHNIPIFDLIAQYTNILSQYQEQRLDLASSFIEMAARLVEMKSYLLLPRSEEGERMREELTGQLIEYDLCKKMAEKLKVMGQNKYIVVRKPAQVDFDTEYTMRHQPQELADAWRALSGRKHQRRAPKAERFDKLVTAEYVSVSSRVVHLLRSLVKGKAATLGQLFEKNAGRSTTVATFLAVLDLVRHGRIRIEDDMGVTLSRNKLVKQAQEEPQWT